MAVEFEGDGTPTGGANRYIDSLVLGGYWKAPEGSGPPRITFQLAEEVHPDNKAWSADQADAARKALQLWANVANIQIVEATADEVANIKLWQYDKDYFTDVLGQPGASLAYSQVPGYENGLAEDDNTLSIWFNSEGDGWSDPNGLREGGYAFVTLVHELGHALGLAHPHDGGIYAGTSPDVFPDVTNAFDMGKDQLNQGIFTIMSYIDGWQSKFPDHLPLAGKFGFGWQSSPMAFDIAAMQEIYGPNTSFKTGNDIYQLPVTPGAGGWSCIWDAGGNDTISAEGATSGVTISLKAATLSGPDGGGVPSYAFNVIGGFTIANGVIIENAEGCDHNDVLNGNAAANILEGQDGNDTLRGLGGHDTLNGGMGEDFASYYLEGAIKLALDGSFASAGSALGDTLISIESVSGSNTGGDSLAGNAGTNDLRGNGGNDKLYGRDGNDSLYGGDGNDGLYGGSGRDMLDGGRGFDAVSYYYQAAVTLSLVAGAVNGGGADGDVLKSIEAAYGSNTGGDAMTGNADANVLAGNGGNDTLLGKDGNDFLSGGHGKDTLSGGAGYDRYYYGSLADAGDVLLNFSAADSIVFKGAAFGGLKAGTLSPTEFGLINGGFGFPSGKLFYYRLSDDTLWFDADKGGAGKAVMICDIAHDYAFSAADIQIL